MEEILKAIEDFKTKVMAKLDEMTRPKTSAEILAGWPVSDVVPAPKSEPEPEPELTLTGREKVELEIALNGYYQSSKNIVECPENPTGYVVPGDGYEWKRLINLICGDRIIWKLTMVQE